ncbi:Mu-like prophage major head subunit gpT family protein [Spartinivicinus ruber]|uniref:Mu-like prophage major head subunit gpT family protein n=1 Tax=Spartinivicinus ruber TaxID=2683272 RepID=UPI0022A6F494|nr:Mu-like prophage major head subunit gpT family protein [Spartinivicinus ruber]
MTNTGIYAPMFQEMGRATSAFPDELTFPLLQAGFAETCYDGQYFFDNDHPVNTQVDGQGTDNSVSNIIKDDAYQGPTWYLMDTSRAIKPIIFQERKKPKFVPMTKEEDESVFMRGEYRYGVDLRCNVGFGFWQMAIAVQAEFGLDSLWEAKARMSEFKADGGRPLDLSPNLIVAPATLEKKITQTLSRELIQEGNTTVSNELKGAFSTLISRRL